MNPYQWPAICGVCGEGGMTTYRGISANWADRFLHHADPSVCRDNLERQRRERESRKTPYVEQGEGI